MHLCLDMQRLFGPDGPWATPWVEKVLPNIVALARLSGARTIFTRFVPPESSDLAEGMWRAYYAKWRSITREEIDVALLDLLPELASFVPPASTFDKRVYSAFSDGRLHGWLIRKGVNTLVISGAETDVCVLATVLSAVDLGYRVIVARDALCSSADESHDALLSLYAKRFDVQIELADCRTIQLLWQEGD